MKTKENFNLLIIDAQEDFCNPETGSLYVKGASNDCKRIAQFIRENGNNIKSIVLTVDWHSFNHCSFSTTWGKENKIISTPMEKWFNEHPDVIPMEMPGIVDDNIITWPQHCIAYDKGAAIQPLVLKACMDFKAKYPDKKIIVFKKGVDGEEYSAFARNEMGYSDEQTSFLMDNKTPLYIVGEAADVCVKNSLSHLMSRHDMGNNIVILRNCMSAVDNNFSFEKDHIYQLLVEKGGKIEYTNDNDYNFIDLGLPSGTLWCDRNVGAETPEDAGLLFAWGETEGYTAEDVANDVRVFSWDDYKYANKSGNLTKYDGTDNKLVLDPEDDAATVNLGGGAFMPTHEHCHELFQNTDKVLVLTDGSEVVYEGSEADYFNWPSNNYNGNDVKLKGVKFVNRTDPSKFIFVPAAGGANDGEVNYVGDGGLFWSSSLDEGNANNAWYCYFDGSGAGMDYDDRCYGYSVRAVR